MKKVLFVIPTFHHGGSNRHLLNVLSMIDVSKYQIDIFGVVDTGPYKSLFSEYNILRGSCISTGIFQQFENIKKENPFNFIIKTIIKILHRLANIVLKDQSYELFLKSTFNRLKDYDSVVAVEEGVATRFAHHINTKNRIAYVHCDYSYYYRAAQTDEQPIYANYNTIIFVSKYTKEVFTNIYPTLKDKTMTIYNVLNSESILEMSKQTDILGSEFDYSTFCLISIGRLSPVKRFDIIPALARRLMDAGCKFKWYIIGSGAEYDKISKQIHDHNVSDTVIMLGEKQNPYPYISKSDLLVCTSESEAYPTVINEAILLDVYVVSTDFKSAKEILYDEADGLIVTKDQLTETIKPLINNGRITKRKEPVNTKRDFLNIDNIKQFEKLLDYKDERD